MWCIGRITAEYRDRMYALLSLYARPYNAQEPVVCVDEKSKQLLRQTRAPIPAQPGQCAREDYEYKRAGTRNIFMAIEPKGKHRHVEVTARRTKIDFVAFVTGLLATVYATAIIVHVVLDNLNTHFRKTFVDVLGEEAAATLLVRASAVSLHAQTRQLAQHGGDRNWDHGPTMHRTTHRHRRPAAGGTRTVAAREECCGTRYRMEIHTSGG